MHSVTQCLAGQHPAGLGTTGRVVVVVWFRDETQSVSRDTDPGLPAGLGDPPFVQTVSVPSMSGANFDD